MEKIKSTIKNIIEKIKPKLILFDEKVNTFLPNPKIKKIAYITVGSLFGFMFLIIILGLLLSPLRNNSRDEGTVLKKTNIIVDSPKPQIELNENQKQILMLENEIKELKFPESILNIPIIESNLTI
ncbi:MAG: hypothetical protein WA152_02205 [Microgenomates group bacterium]